MAGQSLIAGWCRALALVGFLTSPIAQAADALPPYLPNLTPPFHGQLQMPFGAVLEKPVRGFSLSSLANVDQRGADFVFTDYENVRFSWQGPLRCVRRWRCDVAVGFDHQSKGFLDGFVDSYHQTFGFPEGDRPALPTNTYGFKVMAGGTTLAGRGGEGETLTNAVVRAVRPGFRGGEAVLALSVPLMGSRDSVAGRVVGVGAGWQKRNLHPRVSLVGVALAGGQTLTGELASQWHWQGQVTVTPPRWVGRRHWWTIFAQGVPVKGRRTDLFNDVGVLLLVEMEVRPGGPARLRFTEDLQSGQDFTLGYYW